MKTLLYIVRHGNSLGNVTKTFYGHYDGPLTEIGHEQAKHVAAYFEDKTVDIIFSSDLMRAVDTIKPTAEKKGLDVILDARLREIYAGKWENRKIDELIVQYPEEYGMWRNKKSNSRCTDGESVYELQQRIVGALTDIAHKNIGKNIVIATHATPIMTMRPFFCRLPLETINGEPYVANASVTVVSYEHGEWEMLSYGDSTHLDGLVTYMAKGF